MAAETQGPDSRSDSDDPSARPSSRVVTIKPGSAAKPPLFCVHAEAGDVSLYYGIAEHLPADRPLLGLCAPAPRELGGDRSLERLAELHVQSIRDTHGTGSYLIAGECTGGALAFEIARQLRSAGEDVALLVLIDSFAPGTPQLRPPMTPALYRTINRLRILGFHLENLIHLGFRDKLAYAATKGRRATAALKRKATRVRGRSSGEESPQRVFRGALAGYTPEAYGAPLVLLRAERLPYGIHTPPPDLGWGALADSVHVETLPGYFTTPISEPGVRILAARLAEHLARVAH